VSPAATWPPTLACIEVPELPLQLAQRRPDAVADQPLAVLEGSRRLGPQQKLAWVNSAAAAHGIRPGMALRAAQGLCLPLRAEVVENPHIEQAVAALWQLVLQHSPQVEPDASVPGLLWADPRGLGEPQPWQARLEAALRQAGWQAKVRLGFHRYFCRALLHADALPALLPSPAAERQAALRVGLGTLPLPAALQQALAELGLKCLGDLLRLPAAEVQQRLGAEATALYRAVNTSAPLRPMYPARLCQLEQDIEPPTSQCEVLVHWVKSLLPDLLQQLTEQGEAATELRVAFRQVQAYPRKIVPLTVVLRAATPSVAVGLWLDLLSLRLQACRFIGPVDRLFLQLQGQRQAPQQTSLLPLPSGRDLQAAALAIRRVQAALGPESTTCAQLCDAHLPEQQFRWQPTDTLCAPPPSPLPLPPRQLMRQWIGSTRRQSLRALQATHGQIVEWFGPYRLSQAWWEPEAAQRDYYYFLTVKQQLLWMYLDATVAAQASSWVLQGVVD
jgi:protein ImuB